ncbi:YkvA family protein [Carboxydothermus ferrireducens]|uniref:YkvA family protein n=1 Tax=Carboxydothermus ferrireducens TaxID=54265 RepID=UPI00041DF56A|nr:YkvA family protein [Carboxydothermus ferrireducens]
MTNQFFEETLNNIGEKDIAQVAKNAEGILDDFKKIGALKKVYSNLKTMVSLIKDFYHGNYRDISPKTIFLITAAIIYVISPADFIPDIFPLIGFTDDATVVTIIARAIKYELDKYRIWQEL